MHNPEPVATHTTQPAARNAYTDAPDLHPNLILGSLQLLFWLFFHPSAWRNYVKDIDATLQPDFCILNLSFTQWRNPKLHKLLIKMYIILPFIFTIPKVLLSGDEISFYITIYVSLLLLISSLLVGTLVSIAISPIVWLYYSINLHFVPLFILLGLIGSINLNLSDQHRYLSIRRRVLGFISSIFSNFSMTFSFSIILSLTLSVISFAITNTISSQLVGRDKGEDASVFVPCVTEDGDAGVLKNGVCNALESTNEEDPTVSSSLGEEDTSIFIPYVTEDGDAGTLEDEICNNLESTNEEGQLLSAFNEKDSGTSSNVLNIHSLNVVLFPIF